MLRRSVPNRVVKLLWNSTRRAPFLRKRGDGMKAADSRRDAHAPEGVALRQSLMGACASATESELADIVARFDAAADAIDVRKPETGMIMIRGRMGGDGAAFNAGEATVTRAVVRLGCGIVGFSYLLGRSTRRARLAAIVDALGQNSAHAATLREEFVRPVMRRQTKECAERRAETAATRVNFFTMVRGED